MANTTKDRLAKAGQAVADAAKKAGPKIAEGTEKTSDEVEQVPSPPCRAASPGAAMTRFARRE
jgi:hypothetical protein